MRIDMGVLTLARASKPKLCPSIFSIRWFLAYRLLPSMTNAICLGIGPCFKELISNSRHWSMAHSTGGRAKKEVNNLDCLRAILFDFQWQYQNTCAGTSSRSRLNCGATEISPSMMISVDYKEGTAVPWWRRQKKKWRKGQRRVESTWLVKMRRNEDGTDNAAVG